MARPTTMPAPVETPCSIRHRMSACTLEARAAPTEATVKSASDTTITGLRPKLSESAPWKRNMKPNARR